jgi:hypothetical protein
MFNFMTDGLRGRKLPFTLTSRDRTGWWNNALNTCGASMLRLHGLSSMLEAVVG